MNTENQHLIFFYVLYFRKENRHWNIIEVVNILYYGDLKQKKIFCIFVHVCIEGITVRWNDIIKVVAY